jgi:phenylalanyl-tRNA synthetase beta chain
MKAPVSWIREYVDLPADVTTDELTHRLTALGLKLEGVESAGAGISGPLVVGRSPSAPPTAPASRRASSAAPTTSRPATSSW